jgi:hypothetical protein
MRCIVRDAGEIALFVVLVLAVTGLWTCLWLPPY